MWIARTIIILPAYRATGTRRYSVLEAIRLPEKRVEQELPTELAIALYSQKLLSFGKARELARMGNYEFAKLLRRGICRHYGAEELKDELTRASGE